MQADPLRHGESAETTGEYLRQAVMTAFCATLQETRLPPMTVMALIAEALGSVYAEVAEAHHSVEACPCGWRPSGQADIAALQNALAATMTPGPIHDLYLVPVAGRA